MDLKEAIAAINPAPTPECKKIAEYLIAFGDEHGELISNLKLQKLMYYAQAYYLANTGNSLFKDDFQAWIYGPVIPALYRDYKGSGSMPLKTDKNLFNLKKELGQVAEYLDQFIAVYMPQSAYDLELLSHSEDPWISARGSKASDENSSEVITKEAMKVFYAEKLRLSKAEVAGA